MFDILLSLESLDTESLFGSGGSGHHPEFPPDRADRLHPPVYVGAGMGGRHLRADARLALRSSISLAYALELVLSRPNFRGDG
ncbi:hypothetical protein [Mesorhizobium sp. M1393]|uniref:hypothetical protein n=1 Tax=Mesorhizobium sp. M1393 TaxID=2957094 RepID=UPI00333D622F